MAYYDFFLTSSLEKVFADERPAKLAHDLSALQGEKVGIQLVYTVAKPSEVHPPKSFQVAVKGFEGTVSFSDVCLVSTTYPCTENHDIYYLRTKPGLYPDLLSPSDGIIRPIFSQYRSLWIELSSEKAGKQDIQIELQEITNEYYNGIEAPEDLLSFSLPFTLKIVGTKPEELHLIHTEWFHADCLADYYNVPPWSEEHWNIVTSFLKAAHDECMINTILTPLFTPSLDTAIGGERTRVQLLDIHQTDGIYSFGFEKLRRWCRICKNIGIEYLEISHFFTQWGARFTPTVYVTVDGKEEKLFGWHKEATDSEYRSFLEALIPALLPVLKKEGYDQKQLFFHISDEPTEEHLTSYRKAKAMITDLLPDAVFMDALSSYSFYEKGIITHPIPANDHIQTFLDHNVPDLWVYYCVAQGNLVPNRFFSMPSARNRIMGTLMFLYDIEGFLHWGFNFYNSAYSKRHINPFQDTSAGDSFPSGDPFLVYPGKEGKALMSIRAKVQNEGFADLQALKTLSRLESKEYVKALINRIAGYHMTFTRYPRSQTFFFQLRNIVNKEIEKRI